MVPEGMLLLFSACDRYLPHTDQQVAAGHALTSAVASTHSAALPNGRQAAHIARSVLPAKRRHQAASKGEHRQMCCCGQAGRALRL